MANLIFCGFFCAGKSSIGRECASLLGRPFLDTDREIEVLDGRGNTVRQIWLEQGEERFRELEREVVEGLATKTGWVIALGGSTLLIPENQRVLKCCGAIIYLYAPFEVLLPRIEKRGLPASMGKEQCRSAFEMRDCIYRDCANHIIPTEGVSINAASLVAASWAESLCCGSG